MSMFPLTERLEACDGQWHLEQIRALVAGAEALLPECAPQALRALLEGIKQHADDLEGRLDELKEELAATA